jgi:hypothetical protein
MAGLQLRPRSHRSGVVSGPTTIYASSRVEPPRARQVTVLDLLDRLLAGGVVIRGQITLAAADIDLVDLDLSLLVAAIDKAAGR